MKIRQLIAELEKFDGELPVVIDGYKLGFGFDLCISEAHKYDNTEYVRIVAGEPFDENDENDEDDEDDEKLIQIRKILKMKGEFEYSDEEFKDIYGILPDDLINQTSETIKDIYDDITMPC